jgi:hypothetical protein
MLNSVLGGYKLRFMVNIAFQLVVLWAWLTQLGTTVTLRTGDVARQLTEQDIAALELVLPYGAKPWLLNGDLAQIPDTQYIEAYLSPTTATSTLRRGPVVSITRRISRLGPWTTERVDSYAQVAIAGRKFDDIQEDQDVNRPFRVIGRFDDTELVQLVEFIRSNPPAPGGGPNTIRSWPILSIERKVDGSVQVWLRGAVMQGQVIILGQAGHDWVIVSIGMWAA